MARWTHETTLISLAKQHGFFKKLVDSHQQTIEAYEELYVLVKVPEWRADATAYLEVVKKNQRIALGNLRLCEEALLRVQRQIEGASQ